MSSALVKQAETGAEVWLGLLSSSRILQIIRSHRPPNAAYLLPLSALVNAILPAPISQRFAPRYRVVQSTRYARLRELRLRHQCRFVSFHKPTLLALAGYLLHGAFGFHGLGTYTSLVSSFGRGIVKAAAMPPMIVRARGSQYESTALPPPRLRPQPLRIACTMVGQP